MAVSFPHGGAGNVYRDENAGADYNPQKSQIRELLGVYETELERHADRESVFDASLLRVAPTAVWDASSGAFPSGSAAGQLFGVTVAGTVDGVAFNEGEIITALVADASTTTYAANWFRILSLSAIRSAQLHYASHADLVAADVDDSITFVSVRTPDGDEIKYKQAASPTGAAKTSNSGTKGWNPAGIPLPDHWTELTTEGSTDMRSAIESAIAFGGAALRPKNYGVSGEIDVTVDYTWLHMPEGSTITMLDDSNNPFEITSDNFTIYGAGEIDCQSLVSGIVVTAGSLGFRAKGISIKNPTARGINFTDCFSGDEQIFVEDVTVYWDTAGAALVDDQILPLVINVQGTGSTNIIGVNLLRNTVDMSNWTVEQIARILYPLASGAPNPVCVRMNQSGTGTISSQNRVEGNRVLMPVATDEDQWNPTNYGETADGAGQRRPVCYEIKTTAANGVGAMSFAGNFGDGGDIGASFGSLNGFVYEGNRMQFQTHYCLEAATGDKITGSGNYYDGRFALKVISTTNTRIVNLPGSFVIGPRHAGGTSETAVALQGTTEILNMTGSVFIAATAGPIVRLIGEGATDEIANFTACTFIGDGVSGVDAIEVTNTVDTLNLTAAMFQDIDGDTINNASTIATLITVGMSEENCAGTATLGTITQHISGLSNAGAFTSGISLPQGLPSLEQQAGTSDWHYDGKAWMSFRTDDMTLSAPTDDASDTGSFKLCGGGSSGQFRGATLSLFGNEHSTDPGEALLEAGINNDAIIRTQGTGDVILDPAGTGDVLFGTHSAVGAETVTGYIEIKDSGGTVRKLAVLS